MKILMKSHEGTEWKETTLESFNENVKTTREIIIEMNIKDRNPEEYAEDFALDLLKSGRIIDTPMILFKLGESNETKKCPICGTLFIGTGALSRRDNKTTICPQCGTNEALEGYEAVYTR